MRRLDDPPDAGKVVERHLAKRELGFLVAYVRSEEAVNTSRDVTLEANGQLTLSRANGQSTRRVAPVSAWPQTAKEQRRPLPTGWVPRVCSWIQPFNGR